MTSDNDVLALLRQAIERVGTENLVRRPGLARNVFGDMFPTDPLVVALLSAAVDSGAVARLQEGGEGDQDIIAPRLADGIASSRGIVPQHARWAVDMWAVALGRSDRMPAPLEQARAGQAPAGGAGHVPGGEPTPPAGDTTTAPAETATMPADASVTAPADGSRTTPHPGGRMDESSATRVVAAESETVRLTPRSQLETERLETKSVSRPRRGAAVAAKGDTAGEEPSRRKRRLIPIVAAIAVAVLVAGVSTAVLLTAKRTPPPQPGTQHAMTAAVLPRIGNAAASIGSGMAHVELGGKRLPLKNLDTVAVQQGPVEIAFGNSLVRLDSGTQAVLGAATKSKPATLSLASGANVYASIAKGQELFLAPVGSQEHVQLSTGRFAMTCSPTCDYYTLDEPQTVHVGDPMTAVRMQPHQRLRSSVEAKDSMTMSMPTPTTSTGGSASASPSPSGSDDMGGMAGMNMSTPAPATGSATAAPTGVLPDFLRHAPWVAENLGLDAKEGRPGKGTISGATLVGSTWTFMLSGRKDVPAPVHRAVTFGQSHCGDQWGAWGCLITATSSYRDASGHLQKLSGNVSAGRNGPSDVLIAYAKVPTACSGFGKSDGMQAIIDTVDLGEKSGLRTGSYTCNGKRQSLATATIDAVADDITKDAKNFTIPGADEDLVLEHALRGTCARSARVLSGVVPGAAVACDLKELDNGDPRTLELYRFQDLDSLHAAYDSFFSRSGLESDVGNCDQGKCERSISGGRRLIYGNATFVQTNEPQLLLVVALGNSTPALGAWLQDQQDFAVDPVPVRGL